MFQLDKISVWFFYNLEIPMSIMAALGMALSVVPRRWTAWLIRHDHATFMHIKEKYGQDSAIFMQRLFGCMIVALASFFGAMWIGFEGVGKYSTIFGVLLIVCGLFLIFLPQYFRDRIASDTHSSRSTNISRYRYSGEIVIFKLFGGVIVLSSLVILVSIYWSNGIFRKL